MYILRPTYPRDKKKTSFPFVDRLTDMLIQYKQDLG